MPKRAIYLHRVPRIGELSRSSVFAVLWALLILEEKSDGLLYSFWTEVPLVLLAVAVVVRPTSVLLFALFAGVELVNHIELAPGTGNHYYLISSVNLAWLFALAAALRKGEPLDGDALFDRVAPAACWLLTVVYVAAAFHKVNAGFLDPAGSCFPFTYDRARETLPLLPPLFGSLPMFGIYGTLAVEAALPFLLLCGRTRGAALLVGFVFHLFVGLRHPSFSVTAYSIYLFFLPASFWQAARARVEASRFAQLAWWPVGSFVVVYAFVCFYGPNFALDPPRPRLHELAWFLFFAVVGVLVLTVVGNAWRTLGASARRVPSALQAGLVVLLAVNALGPYTGFKTTTVFSMYSNLRTERSSNHLLVPKQAIQLFDEQDDLVTIRDSNDPFLRDLADKGLQIPFFELRRRVTGREALPGAVRVEFERGGETISLADARTDPELARPLGFAERKLRHFRGIPAEAVNRCQW